MECFLLFALLFAITLCVSSNIACLLKVFKIEKNTAKMSTEYHEILLSLVDNFEQVDDKIDALSNKIDIELDNFQTNIDRISVHTENIDRSLQAGREALETAKPIKPNNWDGMRKAFTPGQRIDIHE